MKMLRWLKRNVFLVLSLLAILGIFAVPSWIVYNEYQRTGYITCIGYDGQTLTLPFSKGMWLHDNMFSFYSPYTKKKMRIRMDCVVVYDD